MKNKYVPYLLLLPAFLLICIFKIYPVLTTLRQAFVVDGALSLATFQRVFSEKTFWNCLKVTMKFNVVTVPLQILISFVLALLVPPRQKARAYSAPFSTFLLQFPPPFLSWYGT